MTKNPLLKILPHLTRREMTRFREFAHSPYFNKHSGVRALTDLLSKTYPRFEEKKYAREHLYPALFPGQPHDQPKLALIFTYTLRLLEKFIQTEESFRENGNERPALLLRFLRERGLVFYLEKKWQENFNGGKKIKDKNQLVWHDEMDAAAIQMRRFERDFLLEKQPLTDALFAKEKLKNACEIYLRSQYLKREFEATPLMPAVFEVVKKHPGAFVETPSVFMYLKCYELLAGGSPDDYPQAFEAVSEQAAELEKEDLQSLFSYLQNFCIAQINQGNEPFLRHLFEIYLSQLDRSLLLVDERLPEWHYKNIVTTGLRLNEHEWVRRFLDEYRPRLSPEVAENAYSYNLATYYYHLQKLDEVLHLLVQVEYTDLRYNLDAKSLLLRTYFDLEEEEPFLALCDAFRQFLKRKKALTEFQKRGYVNLIKYARRLFRLKSNRGFVGKKKWAAEREKLESDMAESDTIFNRKWLEEKWAAL